MELRKIIEQNKDELAKIEEILIYSESMRDDELTQRAENVRLNILIQQKYFYDYDNEKEKFRIRKISGK